MTASRIRLALGLLAAPALIACSPATPSAPAAPNAGPVAWTIGDASFASRLEDKVGPSQVGANSKPDLKARLVLSSTRAVTIRSIDIVQQGSNIPAVSYPVQWSTANGSRPFLAVFGSNGMALQNAYSPSLTTLDGSLTVDLYGDGMGADGVPLTAAGTRFDIQVTDGDGNTQTKAIQAN